VNNLEQAEVFKISLFFFILTLHCPVITKLPPTVSPATPNCVDFLQIQNVKDIFLISNFLHVLNAVYFLLGISPSSEFYMPTFRNTLFYLHRQVGMKYD